MNESNILDDLDRPPKPQHSTHRSRAFRYLIYILGIWLGLLYQSYRMYRGLWIFHPDFVEAQYELLQLGLAGAWLFSGLGLLAAIRAVRTGDKDLLLILVLVLHGVLLVGISVKGVVG